MITITVGPKTTLKQVKIDVMRQVLRREGTVAGASRALKIDPVTYYNLLGKGVVQRVRGAKKKTPDG